MNKLLYLLFAVVIALPLAAQNKYVGVKGCACHNMPKQGKQVDVWKKSEHAKAFEALKSDKAAEIAKKNGIAAAAEAKQCLECHTTGAGEAAEKTFAAADGVQCEACHGPASGYKALHNKPENKEKAVAAGLLKADEKTCKQCHGANKMHDAKPFDFKKAWEEIKHPVPKG